MALLKVSKGMFNNNNNNKIMNKIAVLWQTLVTAGKHCVTVVGRPSQVKCKMVFFVNQKREISVRGKVIN